MLRIKNTDIKIPNKYCIKSSMVIDDDVFYLVSDVSDNKFLFVKEKSLNLVYAHPISMYSIGDETKVFCARYKHVVEKLLRSNTDISKKELSNFFTYFNPINSERLDMFDISKKTSVVNREWKQASVLHNHKELTFKYNTTNGVFTIEALGPSKMKTIVMRIGVTKYTMVIDEDNDSIITDFFDGDDGLISLHQIYDWY